MKRSLPREHAEGATATSALAANTSTLAATPGARSATALPRAGEQVPTRIDGDPPPMFSLVLATYGRSDVLEPMLASLIAQTCRDFELIVVDQNADDRVVPLLEPMQRAGVAVAHLRIGQPNLSAARNLGISQARGIFVAFPDDDCWYEPDCLAQVAAASRIQPVVSGWVARWVEACPDSLPELQVEVSGSALRKFRGGDASSISLFLRRDGLRAISGFDARIGVGRYYGAGEETDLMIRFLDAGLAVRSLPMARVHHRHDCERPALTRARWQAVIRRERGVGALYVKHGLAWRVIARGLLAPLWNGMTSRRPVDGLLYGLAAVFGRLAGMIRWRLAEPRSTRGSHDAASTAGDQERGR
ncbi:MAG: glycosyltransferase family 2 protein [Burkholderiaceae bacterium]